MSAYREAERLAVKAFPPNPASVHAVECAKVFALLALTEAIQGLDNTMHDTLTRIAFAIGDVTKH